MSLINKLVLGIYNNQLKDVDNKQQNMTWDNEVAIEENIHIKKEMIIYIHMTISMPKKKKILKFYH